jgi:SAM-dependent methyltransferase
MLYLTREASPLNTCIRLFLNSVPVRLEDVRSALNPFSAESLAASGLAAIDGDTVVPLVTLMPLDGVYLVFDIPMQIGAGAAPDHVVGISNSAMHVSNSMIRRHSRRTLDIGTGSGNLAFSAAGFSDEVYGVDCNPRAVNFAQFGAWLNGFEHIRFLQGDAFDPVRGSSFDLVFANLPFVISPNLRYQYRDAGMRADEFSKRIVREAPTVLTENGFAQFLCQWAHIQGEDWQERLACWFEGTGCDVLVLRLEELEASAYAERWIQDTEPCSMAASEEVFIDWMRYYGSERVEAVSSGIITMRRTRTPAHWIRIEEISRSMSSSWGDALLRRFDLIDFVEGNASKDALLNRRLRPAPDLRLVQTNSVGDGKWRPLAAEIRLTEGLHYDGNIDPLVANLITQFNGSRTVSEALDALAKATGVASERIEGRFLTILRELIARGFILPSEEPGS